MNLETGNCDPNRLELFLRGDLSDVENSKVADHLDGCLACREHLELRAADGTFWREAEQLLVPTLPVAEGTMADDVGRSARQPLQIQSVLDALSPTDDPKMLGRLGNHEVSGVVGAGGMGVVLKGTDPSLDRTVAIKVLAPHLALSAAARKRFDREAKAAAAVLHPNVIAIHGVSNDQSLPYLVMPYIRGASLQKRLDQEGLLCINEILRISSQIAAGLAAAHAQGLVHRDIKPANILLEEGVERVAITDFGLARAVDDASLTRTGMIAGTPLYMSPEQSRGEPVQQQSDLFSLGSVMYAMCTGRPPFRAETSYGVFQRINEDQPTAINELNPSIPDWMVSIVKKLMAKQPDKRFESAEEVSELLEACLAHVQQPSTVPLPMELIPKPGVRRKTSIALGLSGVAMVLLGALWAIFWPTAELSKLSENRTKSARENVDLDPADPNQSLLHFCHSDGTPIRPFVADEELRRRLNRQGTPDISADGKKVTFDAWSTYGSWHSSQILVADIAGTNAHVICDGFMPSFSPDGSQLAISRHQKYTKADNVTGSSIWIVSTDGSSKRMVAERGAWGARWSGDGRSLVFYSGVDDKGMPVKENFLRLFDLRTNTISNVFNHEESPFAYIEFQFDWAFGEKRVVAFSGVLNENNQRVSATIDVDVGLKSLKLFTGVEIGRERNYSWHPNGQWLLITDSDYGRAAPMNLATTSSNVFLPELSGLPDDVRASDAAYTPDGKHLIMSLLALPDPRRQGQTGSL